MTYLGGGALGQGPASEVLTLDMGLKKSAIGMKSVSVSADTLGEVSGMGKYWHNKGIGTPLVLTSSVMVGLP